MRVKLENPTVLAKIIDIISELVVEVRIKVNEEGLSITAMDPANVSMVSFKLPKSSFSQFEVDEESLGVNLENFKRILKRTGMNSSLLMERQDNVLHLQIQDRIKRNFKLGLIEIETEEKEMPSLEFSSSVRISSQDLIDSIEDCAVVADACSFIISDNTFVIEARGLNSARAEFSGDEAKIEAENCKSRYSIEYLQKFIKASKLFDSTHLRFANDHPLVLDVQNNFMELSFLLAPRVGTED